MKIGSKLNLSQFSKRLFDQRTKLGLTQSELSERLKGEDHVSVKTINTWENFEDDGAKIGLKAANLIALSEALDCDIDYLIGKQILPRREESDVQNATGLSDASITRLRILKKAAENGSGSRGEEYCLQRLDFYSAFIADAGIAGLLELFPGSIIKLLHGSLSEQEREVFQDKNAALDFYYFEAQKEIIRFFERFFDTNK